MLYLESEVVANSIVLWTLEATRNRHFEFWSPLLSNQMAELLNVVHLLEKNEERSFIKTFYFE